MSDTSTIDEPERKVKLKEYRFQRRFLFGCTLSLVVGTILWIIAMSTNRWFIVTGGQGIFVESHRRYFKSSHTGIWKGCRYALLPMPTKPTTVRNYTMFAQPMDGLPALKKQWAEKDFVQEFQQVELPELETITEINESFRQKLFAEWLTSPAKFKDLSVKFKSLIQKTKALKVVYVNPSDDEATKPFEDLIAPTHINQTYTARVLVPEQVRNVLFEGWEGKGLEFFRLLAHYARNLNIDSSIFRDNVKYVFRPPTPPKRGSTANGYFYQKWKKCTHHNLFANAAELEADPSVDEELLDLSRASATFAIITVFVMVLGFIFSLYTFMNPRYMYKRLAGGVHFISALSSATVCATVDLSIDHAQEHLRFAFPPQADFVYGYGFYFGIIVSIINFFSCVTFLWYSKKKKGNKAFNEEMGMADEEINIGR